MIAITTRSSISVNPAAGYTRAASQGWPEASGGGTIESSRNSSLLRAGLDLDLKGMSGPVRGIGGIICFYLDQLCLGTGAGRLNLDADDGPLLRQCGTRPSQAQLRGSELPGFAGVAGACGQAEQRPVQPGLRQPFGLQPPFLRRTESRWATPTLNKAR